MFPFLASRSMLPTPKFWSNIPCLRLFLGLCSLLTRTPIRSPIYKTRQPHYSLTNPQVTQESLSLSSTATATATTTGMFTEKMSHVFLLGCLTLEQTKSGLMVQRLVYLDQHRKTRPVSKVCACVWVCVFECVCVMCVWVCDFLCVCLREADSVCSPAGQCQQQQWEL